MPADLPRTTHTKLQSTPTPHMWRMMRVAKKSAGVLAVVVGVTFMAFLLSWLSPTDPATRYFTDHGLVPTASQLANKRHELGLDRPILEQYGSWLVSVCQGDLGVSMRNGRPVAASLAECMPYTLALAASALLLTLLISVLIGLLCAYKKDGLLDNVVRIITYLFCSLPTFFVALLLLYVLSAQLHWLPVRSAGGVQGIVMPTLALALPLSAWYVRQVRVIALDQLASPYVDGLRSRGLTERRILFCHVLKNSLTPLLALVAISVGSLLGGAAIIESIFDWPGVGNLSVAAIGARDYPVIQAYALLMALVYLAVNGLVDLACQAIDPRMRYGEAS